MGNVCANNRSISRFGFMPAIVRSHSKDSHTVRLYSPDRHISFDQSLDGPLSIPLSKGDQVYCLINSDRVIITPARSLELETVIGQITRPTAEEYYLFQGSSGLVAVVPLTGLKSTFEIAMKPVSCIFRRSHEGIKLKIDKYNPFLYYTVEDQSEKRHLSRFRTPISADSKAATLQLNLLKDRYTGYRRVTKDGNAFFRCVFVQFIEHFTRKTTEITELDKFLIQVDSKLSYFAMLPEYQQYSDRVSNVLHKLRNVKAAGEWEDLACAQWMLQDISVDLAMVNYLRLLVANYTAVHCRSARLKRFMNTDAREVVKNILNFGQEPETIVKYVLPDLLGVVILQQDVSIDCDEVFETLYAPEKEGSYPILHICKSSSASYHILYSTATSQVDQYDYQSHTYDLSPVPDSKPFLNELYFTISDSGRQSVQT